MTRKCTNPNCKWKTEANFEQCQRCGQALPTAEASFKPVRHASLVHGFFARNPASGPVGSTTPPPPGVGAPAAPKPVVTDSVSTNPYSVGRDAWDMYLAWKDRIEAVKAAQKLAMETGCSFTLASNSWRQR
jgi:hypothetical protein